MRIPGFMLAMVFVSANIVFGQVGAEDQERSALSALIAHVDEKMKASDSRNEKRFPNFEAQDRTFVLETGSRSSVNSQVVGGAVGRDRRFVPQSHPRPSHERPRR